MKQLRVEKRRDRKESSVIEAPIEERKETNQTHIIQVRINSSLYNTIQESLNSLNTAGDYSYTSIADIVRASLNAHRDGMELTEVAANSREKTTTSIRVNETLYQFHKELPHRKKTEILERAVRTFLKERL